MADVYEVEHVRLGARFAAKVLRPGRDGWDTSVRRFLREARLLARLKSDHIVRVVDVSDDEQETPFYVMELLDGQDLRGLIRKNAEFSVSRALKIVTDACVGIGVAHAAGLVHRDLKPENLFITHRDSGEELCKLLDFGVSKGTGLATTEAGAVIGTVAYMSPEQVESAGTVTTSADVYALGAILYELLTGRPPHVADTVERLMFKILTSTPDPIGALRPDVPLELEQTIFRALSRDPADRFGSAAEFADALRQLAAAAGAHPTATVRSGAEAGIRPLQRRRRVKLWLGVGAATAASFLALLAISKRSLETARLPTPALEPSPPTRVMSPILPSLTPLPPLLESANAAAPLTSNAAKPRASARRAVQAPSPQRHAEAAHQPATRASDPVAAPAQLPKIQFELQNPYAKK